MSNKVVLKNASGRLETFNLPHEVYCAKMGACSCSTMRFRKTALDKRTGERRFQVVERRVPKSITLLPFTDSPPLHTAVLDCPEVKAAVTLLPKRVRVERLP